jgi:hypothetical protein
MRVVQRRDQPDAAGRRSGRLAACLRRARGARLAALLTPAAVPTATQALAFSVTAGAQPVTLTGLGGIAPVGSAFSIFGRPSTDPFAAGATASAVGWTLLYSGAWTGAPVTFTTPLALAAGQVAALVVYPRASMCKKPQTTTPTTHPSTDT